MPFKPYLHELHSQNPISMFTIRKASLADCGLIRALASRIWAPTYGSILSEEQLDYMFEMMYAEESLARQMTEEGHQYFIISDEAGPAGYLSIEPKADDVYNFQKIYSLPEKHGRGIGRFIIEQGVAYLKTIHPGPFTVELYVNRHNPAVGFYKHMGLKEVATRDHAIGQGYFMNDYVMAMEVENG